MITDDPTNPEITRGVDTTPVPQSKVYLALSAEEIAKGFVRPIRGTYKHLTCGTTTTMAQRLAETYARYPSFYGATYCVRCSMHRPVTEFIWMDGTPVGS